MKIELYGSSDDLVEVETRDKNGDTKQLEFDVCGKEEAYFKVIDAYTGKGFIVKAFYADNGCWGFGILQIREGILLPEWDNCDYNTGWNAKFSTEESGYSVHLFLTVPEGTAIMKIDPKLE